MTSMLQRDAFEKEKVIRNLEGEVEAQVTRRMKGRSRRKSMSRSKIRIRSRRRSQRRRRVVEGAAAEAVRSKKNQ